MIDWRPDVLGEGFECTDIDLGEDAEGPLCATLVRSLPQPLGFWARLLRRERELEDCDVLYVHGWSDYFFQTRLANFYTDRGARFFALDLRKYGRSLREGQTPGYIEHLDEYDEEIDAAVSIIRGFDGEIRSVEEAAAEDGDERAPAVEDAAAVSVEAAIEGGVERGSGAVDGTRIARRRRLLLLGHSTGGLVLSLWADRHRGEADAIVLNSPWLELQLSGAARRALLPMVNVRARLSPHEIALPQLDMGFYAQAQEGCNTPEELALINHDWRPQQTLPVRAAWLRAIIEGHTKVDAGIDVGAPVCVLLSARSQFGLNWNDAMLRADTVLEVEAVARAALKLGPSVAVERIDGALHDVFLSEAGVRADAYSRMERWLLGWRTWSLRAEAGSRLAS